MQLASSVATCSRWPLRLATVGFTLWLTSSVPGIGAAEMRTFTDTSGRTMVAEVLEATEISVRIRRDDDRVFELSLEKLSAADRAFIAAWRLKRALAFGGIEVSAHRVRLDSDRTQTRSSTRKTEDWCYRMAITNHSRADLSGLTIEYRMFYVDDSAKADRDELPLQRKTGRTTISQLAAGATTELQSTVVTLQLVQLKPGHRYSGTSKRSVEDALAGLWVRVSHQGEILHEFASPTTLIKSQSW